MNRLLSFLIAGVLFISCKDYKNYTMKTYYLKANPGNLPGIFIIDKPLSASTDIMAFKKAHTAFASVKDKSDDKNNIPLKFELYDNYDQLIVINFWETRKIGALQK